MSHPRLVLNILAVKDLDRSSAFYAAVLGWPQRVRVTSYVELGLPDQPGLGLYLRTSFARNTGQLPAEVAPEAITGTELYFQVADLDAAEQRLRGAGSRQLAARADRDWGDAASYWADPDGNVLVVATPLRRA